MLGYYVIFEAEIDQGPPAGIIILENIDRDALLWNHRSKLWQYDPQTALRFLADPDNQERVAKADRASAEQATLVVTQGREPLPDEPTIRMIFQWKGVPPDD